MAVGLVEQLQAEGVKDDDLHAALIERFGISEDEATERIGVALYNEGDIVGEPINPGITRSEIERREQVTADKLDRMTWKQGEAEYTPPGTHSEGGDA